MLVIIVRIVTGLFLVIAGASILRQKTVKVNTKTIRTVKSKEYTHGVPLVLFKAAGGVIILLGLLIWVFGFPGVFVGLNLKILVKGKVAEGNFGTGGTEVSAFVCGFPPLTAVSNQEICRQQRPEVQTFSGVTASPKTKNSPVLLI
ncbi:hypothetical protein R70723_22975 [Paenibacillus sp. FSL R7-0273]|uniref:hypothetical protein n=1 Tax=Paenibacillus sp. FSL R7-0273 TaxID=1536772 RepID=UPI0004F7FF0B|nr:hypothetical protein [Paenibacillus sp. FSL R7-0273]AIQ48459.1 hypothetical protein R70723_22975 [Paenibacillus sp. FSL R7-0273]OMF86332.1 hypothetical protein BK144_26420 [Paenibacillus sp. FSL R7-0273]